MLRLGFIVFSLFAFFIVGCDNDKTNELTKQKTWDSLKGKWYVAHGMRNGSRTNTLDKTYFDFTSDSTLMTNIERIDKEFKYSLKGNSIIQHGGLISLYNIRRLEMDTLEMQFEYSHYSIYLTLSREKADRIKNLEDSTEQIVN